jgi:hypothetical protein
MYRTRYDACEQCHARRPSAELMMLERFKVGVFGQGSVQLPRVTAC